MNNQGKEVKMSCVLIAVKKDTIQEIVKLDEDLGPGIEIEEEGVDLPETEGGGDLEAEIGHEVGLMIDMTQDLRAAILEEEETEIAVKEGIVMGEMENTEMTTKIEGMIVIEEIEITDVIVMIGVMTAEMVKGMTEDAIRRVDLTKKVETKEEGTVDQTLIAALKKIEIMKEKRRGSKSQLTEDQKDLKGGQGQREDLIDVRIDVQIEDLVVFRVILIDRKIMIMITITGKIQLTTEIKSH